MDIRWIFGDSVASYSKLSPCSLSFQEMMKLTKFIKSIIFWAHLRKAYWLISKSMPPIWNSTSQSLKEQVSWSWFLTPPQSAKIWSRNYWCTIQIIESPPVKLWNTCGSRSWESKSICLNSSMQAPWLNQVSELTLLILYLNTASTPMVELRSKPDKSKVTQIKRRMTSLLKPKNFPIWWAKSMGSEVTLMRTNFQWLKAVKTLLKLTTWIQFNLVRKCKSNIQTWTRANTIKSPQRPKPFSRKIQRINWSQIKDGLSWRRRATTCMSLLTVKITKQSKLITTSITQLLTNNIKWNTVPKTPAKLLATLTKRRTEEWTIRASTNSSNHSMHLAITAVITNEQNKNNKLN